MQDDQDISQDRAKPDFSDMRSGLADGGNKLSQAIGEAKDGLTAKAKDIASESAEALSSQAEAVQKNLSSAITAFSGAIRAASEHLANSDQKGASRFALEAAGGLERMSESLKDKPFQDVLAEIRAFGTQNPGVLVGGSVIAGLALGRFIKSSSPNSNSSSNSNSNAGSGKASDQADANRASHEPASSPGYEPFGSSVTGSEI